MRRRFINNRRFDIDSYLTIEALGYVSIFFSGNVSLEYAINGSGWVEYEDYANLYIREGQTISFRGEIEKGVDYAGMFRLGGKCNLRGNCMSILFGDKANLENSIADFPNVFRDLFNGCTGIVSVSKKFLPATTLSSSCYHSMFSGCTGLTQAPELPATKLKDSCYNNMFSGCSNLNYIKMLATDIPAISCLNGWVIGVSSTGTFVKNKDATWNTTPGALGNSGVPAGWTVVNDGEESGGNAKIITFYIAKDLRHSNFISYQAEELMTFGEWVVSDYNPDGYYTAEGVTNTYIISPYTNLSVVANGGMAIRTIDTIIEGYYYYLG